MECVSYVRPDRRYCVMLDAKPQAVAIAMWSAAFNLNGGAELRKSARRNRNLVTVNWPTVLRLALALPGTEESTSYGTPAVRVKGKLFVRLREEGDVIVVRIERAERAMRMRAVPGAFFITDHYANYPWMLVRLDAVNAGELEELLIDAWKLVAPKRLVAEFE